jgi:cell division protein FtsA
MPGKRDIIVGLDIGTTKICAVVGEISNEGVDIIGIGTHASEGLRKGVVVDIESTVESIKKAVEEGELMSGCEITSVYIGIAGSHIMGFNSKGIIAIKGREVTQRDIDRVIDAARAVAIPVDREVIHVLPREYSVDDQNGIQNPIGMTGVRMEVDVHIVTGAVTSVHNIIKCVNRAGLDFKDIVLESIASSEAALGSEEKKLGAALLDMGGGTTDLAVFINEKIEHTFVLSIGGRNFTNDIAIGLSASPVEAEKIKMKYGACLPDIIDKDEIIEVQGMGGRKPKKIPRHIIGEILQPRVEEIFMLIKRELQRVNIDKQISAGIILTGGSSLVAGTVEIAEAVFEQPVRLGNPKGVGGLVNIIDNPIYSTGVGLVLYGLKNQHVKDFQINESNIFNKVIFKMKKWFKNIL